jgi:hypothetical protein
MNRNLYFKLVSIAVILGMLLGACGAPSYEEPAGEPVEEPTEEPAATELPPVLDATNLGETFGPGRIVLANDLKMLSPELIAQMEPVNEESDTITAAQLDATGGVIKFVMADPQTFSKGQVISTGITEDTPYGLLRKVVDVNEVGNEVFVTTEQAKLEDAIQEGEFSVTYSQVTSSLDSVASSQGSGALMKTAPGPAVAPIEIPLNEILYGEEQGPHIKATGKIEVTPDFYFHAEVSGATVQNLVFENKTVIDANINLFSGIEYSRNLNKKVYDQFLSPFPVPGAPFIVITPKIVISVGLDGKVSSGITMGATYENNADMKVTRENNMWDVTRNGYASGEYIAPDFKTTLSARVYARSRLELLLWGVAGPYAQVDGYFRYNASPQDNPWWTLDLGIDGVIGVSVQIFKFDPIHKEFPLYHKTFTPAPEELEPATEPPPAPTEPPPPEPTEPPPAPQPESPLEPTEPPPPAGTGNENILIVYDNTSAFVINITQGSVRIKGLVFNRIDNQGNITASFQADTWGNFYSEYDLVPSNYCPRIALPNSSTTQDCTVSVNYETSQDRYHFWRETSTSKQFEVWQNGTLLQTCEISAGSCGVYMPQP